MKKKVYAVRNGRKTGLFMSWDDCKKQVDAFPGGAVAHGHEDHGVALADDDGAVGLLGDAAGLEADGRAAQVH